MKLQAPYWLDVAHVGRVQIVEWRYRRGMVLGPRRIYWPAGYDLFARTVDGLGLLAHECGHVQQARKYGRFGYLLRYVALWLLTLGAQHPMERDADERAVILEPHAEYAAVCYYAEQLRGIGESVV